MRRNNYIILSLLALMLTSCSITRNIPEDDHLFRGLKEISYVDEQDSLRTETEISHLEPMKEEMEAALATIPNGSLFGSSYYATPWSTRLWIYNHYAHKDTPFARWMTKTFGRQPVLMSQVNPALRASVAQSVLRNNGYMRGQVSYEPIQMSNPRKQKLSYHVRLDSLFTLDSVSYTNFPPALRQLIDSTHEESYLHRGDAFSVANLDAERLRLSTLFRNKGYYYYTANDASYLADTFMTAGRSQLRLQLADGLPEQALRPWYIGQTKVNLRHTMREQLTDSTKRRHLTIFYAGKHSPIRPRVVLKNLRLRPRRLFSYEDYQESLSRINAMGVFSSVDFQFTPRLSADSLASTPDSLDLTLNCVFDHPWDFYVEANAIGRTIGRYGPELRVGLTRKNAFRGAEKLDINLHGTYEWQTSGGSDMNFYQFGADASVEFPRIVAPFYDSDRRQRRSNGTNADDPKAAARRAARQRAAAFNLQRSTLLKFSADVVHQPGYYQMQLISGEWTYRWQSSLQSRHELSPLVLNYQRMTSSTEKFDSVIRANPYLTATMSNMFIPKMRYTYIYNSPSTRHRPIRWETTVEEAGNLLSLCGAGGDYAQFLRIQTDLTKTWPFDVHSSLVGHVNMGAVYSYGNSDEVPFSETFYAGGANGVRAFGVREIGPGSFVRDPSMGRQLSYLTQNGDLKLLANLEYRTQLFGDLHGAMFLDAGNVWRMRSNLKNFLDEIAVGTGLGLRYDLGFLVIRLDWGLALHLPYDTGRSGYFNIHRFSDSQALHFAVGYPF